MSSKPKDIRDDRDILSMIDMMTLTNILPPERCYPNALCTAFHSQFTFGDTKISMEERSMRATAMKAIAVAQQASP
jgi:hypothetical protein